MPLLRSLVIIGVLLASLSACGRRGPLEPPPKQAAATSAAPAPASGVVAVGPEERLASGDQVSDLEGTIDAPAERSIDGVTTAPSVSPKRSGKRPPPIVAPKRDFVLDPLLD